MNKLKFAIASAFAFLLISCSQGVEQTACYSVVPLPQSIVENQGAGFKLDSSTQIAYPEGNGELEKEANRLADYIKQLTGKSLKVTTSQPEKNVIVLEANLQNDNPEGYQLTVDADKIVINGATPAGTFYGIQTLRKSIPEAVKSTVLFPAATINDQPRFAYRGAHLDVSRHFFPVDSVKTFIDMMALHNMNTFHWHLTDDQGWRIEIKKHPELTDLGSKRSGTVIGHNSGNYDSIPVEGFYTQDQIRDIISYAADQHITIIPEIDLPGHMLGALKAYPQLGCTGGPYEVWQQWGVSEDVLCAGNDSTYKFIEDVLDEVADLFPAEYVHIGGDECPKVRWESCEKCQAKIKELGLKSDDHGTKEEKLQSHVIHFASDFLATKGKKTIGWDEILEGGLAPGAVVMSWRGEGGGIEAARQNHDVIMTPNTYLYFDYYQSLDRDNEPDAIGGYLPMERVYSYEPLSPQLSDEEKKHIIGVQANTWTEYIPTFAQVEYMTLPRFAALSEIQWSNAPKDYKAFSHRVLQLLNQYDANHYNYARHILDVTGTLTPDAESGAMMLDLSTADDAPIYYTLDGTEPGESSLLFESPVKIDKSAVIKAKAIRHSGASRVFTDSVAFTKATAHPVELINAPAERYKAKGGETLTDGKYGALSYANGDWVGFYKSDMVAVVDLQAAQNISEVSVNNFVLTGDWIFDAREISVAVSVDGKNFTEVASQKFAQPTQHADKPVMHKLTFKPVEARFVKITEVPESSIPEWHPGAGNPSFLFIDEIGIN